MNDRKRTDACGQFSREASLPRVRRGETIGRYVVIKPLGGGSMGLVYHAFDPDLDRGIALKLVEVHAHRGRRGARVRARLLREARAIAKLSHPNVIAVFDVGEVEHGVFVAMEYVDGETLKKWLSAAPRPWRAVLAVFAQAARGLASAHAAGLVHRDFKPDNVMLGRDGRARVLDFGLVRAARGTPSDPPDTDADRDVAGRGAPTLEESLTHDGMVVGTPAYMAPEQHLGQVADARADQFGFCVALWEALYGQRPFEGRTYAELATAATRGNPKPPEVERGVPRWVHRVLERGLSVQPEARHASMDVVAGELERDPSKRWRRVGLATIGLAVAGAGVAVARQLPATQGADVCTAGRQRVDEVWNGAVKTDLERTFEASGLALAPDVWTRVAAALDAYADEWVTSYEDAGRATRVRGDQSESLLDLRMQCLQRRLGDANALVDVLARADAFVVIGAIDAAHRLGDISECNDVASLIERVPPLADPDQQIAADSLELELAEIRARLIAGMPQTATSRLEAVEPAILSLDYPPISEQFLALKAEAQGDSGNTPASRRTWELAFSQALAARNPRRAAFLASKLVFVIGHRLADFEGTQTWTEVCRGLLRAVPESGEQEASLLSAQGSAAVAAGRYQAAIALHERVRAYWQAAEPESIDMATVLGNLGSAYRELERFDESIELHRRQLAIVRNLYGPKHPQVAFALQMLGTSLTYATRHEEALVELEVALAILREAEFQVGHELAATLEGVGRTLRQLGRLPDAEARHREAYELYLREFGPDHPDVAIALMNIGYTEAAAGQHARALETFTQAQRTFEALQQGGDDHPNGIYAALAVSKALLDPDRAADARAQAERALAANASANLHVTLLGELEFILARAIMEGSPTKADRTRARELVKRARAAFATAPELWQDEIAEIVAFEAAMFSS